MTGAHTHNPGRRQRRTLRLQGYDYAQPGAYYLTICTHERACLFGEIRMGEMHLNGAGHVATQCWLAIPEHFPHVELDAFVVMPNHVHGIIMITGNVGAKNFSPLPRAPLRSPSKTIGSIVRGYKIGVTKWFRQNTNVYTVWQRNYYEHIIRNEASLQRIRDYILTNPARWSEDRENPAFRDDRR
ncbi:MAG: hypothetical protein H3C34_18635 [Caldilineaceae bacterium]|nr:hypothetical protein [Caldilineaceae bacterium]